MTKSYTVVAALLCGLALAQMPGDGISKTTYSSNDPLACKAFLSKYFNVATAPDECAGDICACDATATQPAWQIQQGRVYTLSTGGGGGGGGGASPNPDPGMGFGLHHVNVSAHSVGPNGLTTYELEQKFSENLGDMSKFDAFMDYNAGFYVSDLAKYTKQFDADGVKYLTVSWAPATGGDSGAAAAWVSVFVRVEQSQMILELMSQATSASNAALPVAAALSDARMTARAIKNVPASPSADVLYPVKVSRAVSGKTLAAVEKFYTAMQTTVTAKTDGQDGVSTRCYLWTGAAVDVCFVSRADAATSGSFKPAQFEQMLNGVHKAQLANPECADDKWYDNHYAIDGRSAGSADYIIDYIEANPDTHYFCNGGFIHYIFDPTGWGIQLDLQFTKSPPGCVGSGDDDELLGFGNPACSFGNCTV